ncbi:hypothetical protein Ocin01_10720 [Orchesella cincta]|uniref:Uncharacterized protein n=1 Tax=Orchesella cincta TaxID=48709 RepID=A0A1D2MSA1_ORCCI|nr:hypothetical protein Ocin01_10720 [Orchesella cincta]
MKVAPLVGFLVVVAVIDLAHGRPFEEKSPRDASVYVLGSLYNTAVSHNFSKSQAASDRNESEWNNTEMLNGVHKSQQQEASLSRDRERRQLKTSGGVLIYSGGDAANLAVAFKGSESQAAENDQKSGYNNQNLGMGESMSEEVEMEEEPY